MCLYLILTNALFSLETNATLSKKLSAAKAKAKEIGEIDTARQDLKAVCAILSSFHIHLISSLCIARGI